MAKATSTEPTADDAAGGAKAAARRARAGYADDVRQFFEHRLVLRGDTDVVIALPRDFDKVDAARVARWLEAIAIDSD